MSRRFYIKNTEFRLLLSADETGGYEIWDVPVAEVVPLAQLAIAPCIRYYRVLAGSVILNVVGQGQERTSFTLNARLDVNDDCLVQPAASVELRNVNGWQASRLMMTVAGNSLEKMMEQIAANTPGAPIHPNIDSISKKWGWTVRVIETPVPVISHYRIPTNQAYGY